ncbi:MAG: hypothetical protein B7X10_00560 [Burkholderiales bacterium 21-58-4]|nr:MAG: hypothetical protein B7X10_00560 [Burkholderiales bacterium 21-58-4]
MFNTMFGAAGAVLLVATVAVADPMPATLATPLLNAEHLLSAHKYAAALAAVAQADAVPNKTPDEQLTIAQLRAAIDTASGNRAAAANDYAAILASGALPAAQTQTMAESLASSQYQAGEYAKTVQTIKTYLADDARFHTILLQSYYQMGDCKSISADMAPAIKAAAHGGHGPAETELQMLAYCDTNAKNMPGYVADMELLVQFYPNPTYWSGLIGQLQSDPAYSDRLALDFFRLKLAAGVAAPEADYMEYTQEALQAGLPNTAEQIFAMGQKNGLLGSGADLDRQTRLKALVDKRRDAAKAGAAEQAAQALAGKDFQALFNIGFNEVAGGDASGIALMEQSIRSGALTHIDQAELEMGMGYAMAGEASKANAMWRAVGGNDGAQRLATLWRYIR